jgi:hypothetical protein
LPQQLHTTSAYPTLHGRNIITSATFTELLGAALARALLTVTTPWTLTLKCGEVTLVNFVNVVEATTESRNGFPLYVFRDVCREEEEMNEVTIQEEEYLFGGVRLTGYAIDVMHVVGPRGINTKSISSFSVIMAPDVKDALEQNLRTFRDRGKSQCVLMGGKSRRNIKK